MNADRWREELVAVLAIAASLDDTPVARAILASDAVPFGTVRRQWDTKGRLYVWVNRGQVNDAITPFKPQGGVVGCITAYPPGIPIVAVDDIVG